MSSALSDPADTLAEALARAEADVADVTSQLAAIAESTALVPDDEHDAEGATIGYERARLRSLLSRAEAEVRELQEAAGRLSDGSYGRCTGCGGAIAGERLAALPSTPLCLTCAALRDRR
jgi:RNA polymerase-binding transcription factor DksA